MTLKQFREFLKAECDKTSRADFAARAGVSTAYLSMVINGPKYPGPKVLRAVGMRAVVKRTVVRSYVKVD